MNRDRPTQLLLLSTGLCLVLLACLRTPDAKATQSAPAFKPPISPVRLVATDFYRDFGTVWVRLRGSDGSEMDCGFSRWDGDSARGRLFFGASHPTKPGACFLKLWSPEEGDLLGAIREAAVDSIPRDDWALYLRARSVFDLRSPGLNGLWHLVGALNLREQFYSAARSGHLASIESARKYAGLSGGLDIRSIRFDRGTGSFDVSIRDSTGKEAVALSYGPGLEGELCLWALGRRIPPNIKVVDGGHFDSRYALTLLESALRDPLSGEQALRQRFLPAPDSTDLLSLLDNSVEHCKKWFLEHDGAVGDAP